MRITKRKREGVAAGTQLREAMSHPFRHALGFVPLGTPERWERASVGSPCRAFSRASFWARVMAVTSVRCQL